MTIDTDYLVVGAGAAGMAFVDSLVAESDADVVVVDRRHAPGGHWNDAYPFVQMHQPSAFYGVGSLPLGHDTIDTTGPNAGFYERATGAEICGYFRRVLDDHLLRSGRVRFFGGVDYEVPMAKVVGLEYELAGNRDGEVVMLLHAAGATSYAPLMTEPVLTERYRLLRCHRRGFAGSDPLGSDASIEGHSRDALALLEHLQIDRAHIVGHSGSGVIALQVALDAPGAVRSLALEEPALHAIDARLLAVMSEAAQPLLDLAKSGEPTRAMDRWMRGLSRTWRTDIARTVPGGAHQVLEDAEAFFADVGAVLSWRFDRDRVTALGLPVLHVLAGAPRTPLADVVLRRFRDVVPHTEAVEIPGASHLLHTDQPGLVATELASFFARHTS